MSGALQAASSGRVADDIAVLTVDQLGKSFGSFHAVDGVSLAIRQYEVKAVIGPNGAGKSTLFSCLAGTLRPTSGKIYLNGDDVTLLPVHRRVRRGLVKSFQTTSIFAEMTVEDNVLTAASAAVDWTSADIFRNPWRKPEVRDGVAQVLEEVGLHDQRSMVAAQLSHGDQRKLEIGISIACGARVLLLDEPTAGMGVDDVRDFMMLVERLRKRCGILLVEHNMGIVLGLSDRITVLAQGKVICEGSPADIRADRSVRAAYLGRREV